VKGVLVSLEGNLMVVVGETIVLDLRPAKSSTLEAVFEHALFDALQHLILVI
jgi:hypothetical protein